MDAEKEHTQMMKEISGAIDRYLAKIKEIEQRLKEYRTQKRKVYKE